MGKDTISIEKKVLMSIDMALKTHGKCTFSELVREAFKLYPNEFSLKDIPEWPDSLKFDRPLRKLREEGFISGSHSTEFFLSSKGQKEIEEIKAISAKQQLTIDFRKKS